jgi:hypothetical protein
MPSYRQYRYLHKGDNEWLSEPPTDNDPEVNEQWAEAWAMVRQEAGDAQVEFTEDMYINSEYSDLPEWIEVRIKDDYILPMKMARGVVRAIEGAQSIVFHLGIECYTDDGWGGIGHNEIAITDGGAYITIHAKHGSDEVEVDVSEQFNQAIGETA